MGGSLSRKVLHKYQQHTLVVCWLLLVGRKHFDGWESLDAILAAKRFVLVLEGHIHARKWGTKRVRAKRCTLQTPEYNTTDNNGRSQIIGSSS